MFSISPDALPTVATRKALLVIDLQNDFASPNGALPAAGPEGFVSRTVEVASAFRNSGAGEVIWVRSEFSGHRALGTEGDQIITSDLPHVPRRTGASARGRQTTSGRHEHAAQEADEEAFLSAPPGIEKPACVRPNTDGAKLAPEVAAAVDSKDSVFVKSHYSVFASNPKLMLHLRGRFVTELYICGALSNISVYATGLEAGRHGYEVTIVEDCCGYRNDARHDNAMRQLTQLTGCEQISAADLIKTLPPARTEPERQRQKSESSPRVARDKVPSARQATPAEGPKGLTTFMEELTLDDTAALGLVAPANQPNSPASPSSAMTATPGETQPSPGPTRANRPASRPGGTNLEADPDESSKPGSPNLDVVTQIQKRREQRRSISNTTHGSTTTPKRESKKSSQSANQPDRSVPRAKDTERPETVSKRQPKPTTPPSKSKSKAGTASRDIASASSAVDMDDLSSSEGDDTRGSPAERPATTGADKSSPHKPSTSEPHCEGDTTILTNVLPLDLASNAFERLKHEVRWQRMSHQGGEVPRLVAVQGNVDVDGSMPVYRHPSDESPPLLPFTPTVLAIREEVERHLGHAVNHVLIQYYRDGNDYITEHSDKTLDIVRGSFIANVSLGAQRTMVFRTKRLDKDPSRGYGKPSGPDDAGSADLRASPRASETARAGAAEDDDAPTTATSSKPTSRRVERAPLPHNSLCRMGLSTNKRWLHAIRADKRLAREKSEAELAWGGARISLTFRAIGTFLDADHSHIWGQGAVSKTRSSAGAVINGQTEQAVALLRAFGIENASAEFDWDARYGAGFDVLHLSTAARWFASVDSVVNMRIGMMLGELGLSCAKGSTGGSGSEDDGGGGGGGLVKFADNDAGRSIVEGQVAVMLYLDTVYGDGRTAAQPQLATRLTRFQQGLALLDNWRAVYKTSAADAEVGEDQKAVARRLLKALRRELGIWDGYAKDASSSDGTHSTFIAGGKKASVADFAVWPVLHDMVRVCGDEFFEPMFENLGQYYRRMKMSKGATKILGHELVDTGTKTSGSDEAATD